MNFTIWEIIIITLLTTYFLSHIVVLVFRRRVWRILWIARKPKDAISPYWMYQYLLFMPFFNTYVAIACTWEWIQWKRGKYPEYND